MEDGNSQSNFLVGFLFGSILGALAGMFFAPKSGKELRSKIKEKGTEVLKEAEEIIVIIWVDTFFRLYYTPIKT